MSFNESVQGEATALTDFSLSDADWTPFGLLKSLYIRVGKEPAPRPVTTAQAIANFGLAGDKHASPQSPRQLLLAGSTAYAHWGLPAASLRENLLIDFPTDLVQAT